MNLICPHCQSTNAIPPNLYGQSVVCGVCRGLFQAPAQTAPPAPQPVYVVVEREEPRRQRRSHVSRTAYILIGLFFGVLGVHNFYAGRTGFGVMQLLLCFVLVGVLINPFWVLIEIIVVQHDGRGLEMS